MSGPDTLGIADRPFPSPMTNSVGFHKGVIRRKSLGKLNEMHD